ncbi:serine/threonine-protein kinase [Arthrobacter sp. PsM3]|uniref:serine/threonine-protein kinase n=1 Tax=Arthrobacter sp. PsM3 TaxID=3030531 RepID=UPI00263B022D|nr:serine/threonine-protein kinase [Arthrobacter sp. PsM3]MDN4644981.1 serine/threonine-protein kinase [Arthrobacter sp. PsM3]
MAHVHDYPEPGTELAGYRIQSLIARGGMGVVYRALDVRLGRPVALKLLAPELSANEKFRQRFIRESRLAASVDHPNILPVYGAGEWSGLLYIAMRYVRGTDVKAELDTRGPLPLPEAMRILSDTAAALDAAHAAGLVHRDVKPGNILLSDDRADGRRHVYLTDFGLTKRATSATGVTTAGHFLGTLDYVAPEQIRGGDVDSRADVYALACVAYTLLAGHPPFDHDDDSAQLWAHIIEEPPRLSRERPDVSPAVESAILTGMAKDRDARPPSCGALVAMMSGGGAPAGSRDEASAVTRPAGAAPDHAVEDVLTAAGPPAGDGRSAGSAPRIGRHAGSRRPAGASGQGRALRLAGLGVLLVLLLAAGLLMPRVLSREERVKIRTEGVPYTLEVPKSWTERTRRAGDSTVSVLSATDLSALFAGEPDAPAAAAAQSASDPAGVVGLTIYHRPAGLKGYPPAARVTTAEALLPGRDAHLLDRGAVTVGEVPGQSMEGTMPLSSAATLQVRVLVVETDPVQLIVFFAPSSLFEESTEVFDEIARSLRRTE